MDLTGLHSLFAGTLSRESFKQAEETLKGLDGHPQFILGLLELSLLPTVESPIRRAAAIYLKNTVKRKWKDTISDQDKADFKAKLVWAISNAGPHRDILVSVVGYVVTYEFFEGKWPGLVGIITQLLSSQEAPSVHAGLSMLLELSRFFRYQSSAMLPQFSEILQTLWPQVLAIGEAVVSSPESEARQMLYEVLKIAKFSTARLLPPVVQLPENCSRMTILHLSAIKRSQEADEKCQKWATFNLLRIHSRYLGSATTLSDHDKMYQDFRKLYKKHFTPQITSAYLELLEQWASNERFIAPIALHNIVSYLAALTGSKSSFTLIEPHLQGLFARVLYPLLCPGKEDVELFEDDPIEYVQKFVDIYQDAPTPANAASAFLELLSRKQKTTLPMTINFLESIVSGLKDKSDTNPIEKAGALLMFQTLAKIFTSKNNPVRDQVESFLDHYVVSDLWARSGILRSRALQAIGAVASRDSKIFTFKDRELLQKTFRGVVKCFYDEELPVQVDAALALQSLCGIPDIAAGLCQHIAEIVQKLLDLTKKVDLESLLGALDEFVAKYPEQITPLAIELASQLRDQFINLISDLKDTGLNGDDGDGDMLVIDEDKISSGFGIVKSLTGLQMSLENQPEIQKKLEVIIIPIFLSVYQSRMQDFYTETLDLHDNTIYSIKAVSDQQWLLLEELLKALVDGGYDYFEDAVATLQDYVAYGGSHLAANKSTLEMLIRFCLEVLKCPDDITVDSWNCSLQLLTRILGTAELQNGPMFDFIPLILESVFERISNDHARRLIQATPPRYTVNIVSVILASIYNQPLIAGETLQKHGVLGDFIGLWLQTAPKFNKVEDLKLVVLSCLSLINQPLNDASPFFPFSQRLLEFLCQSLEALPEAISRRAEYDRCDDLDFDGEDEYSYDDDWELDASDADDDGEDEYGEASTVSNASNVQTQSHNSNTTGQVELPGADSSGASITTHISSADAHANALEIYLEEFQDDFGVDSPLLQIDIYNILRVTIGALHTGQPQYYQSILSLLSEKDKAVLEESLQYYPSKA